MGIRELFLPLAESVTSNANKTGWGRGFVPKAIRKWVVRNDLGILSPSIFERDFLVNVLDGHWRRHNRVHSERRNEVERTRAQDSIVALQFLYGRQARTLPRRTRRAMTREAVHRFTEVFAESLSCPRCRRFADRYLAQYESDVDLARKEHEEYVAAYTSR